MHTPSAVPRRHILITGATGGIGLALVQQLAGRHDVLAVGRKPLAEVRTLLPKNVTYCQADLSDPEPASQIIAAAVLKNGWTKLDNVVLNAGIGHVCNNGLDDVALIRRTLDTNLVSTVVLSKALFPWLSKSTGTLTLIGSVAHKGQAMFPAYAASKAGMAGLARALRSEWQGRVSVQVIHPGPTQTAMHEKAGYSPGKMGAYFLKAEDVAAMIVSAMAGGASPVTVSYGRYLLGLVKQGKEL